MDIFSTVLRTRKADSRERITAYYYDKNNNSNIDTLISLPVLIRRLWPCHICSGDAVSGSVINININI